MTTRPAAAAAATTRSARGTGAAEAALMNSGIDWTLLRPGRFMSDALGWRPRSSAVHQYRSRSDEGDVT